jgi:hypothetical protein
MLKLRSLSTGGSVGQYFRFMCSNWIIPFAGQPDGGFWSGIKIYFILLNGHVKVTSVTDVLYIAHCLRLKKPTEFHRLDDSVFKWRGDRKNLLW